MTYAQLTDRLYKVLTDIGISPTALTDGAHFTRDLGLDSLDITDLLIQVETFFSIRIPDEDFWKLETVGQLKEYIADEIFLDGSRLA
ncbi:acyl carrier protein [Spirosoma fluviale]|uniref:Acyl carrier protein n=1 Tax=Spirosoma fluviale TaxID=1597977 RepID=A0A286F9I8_9BACT|nr:phosphopantetheine-binding protein [Spirosoma fluviale]SOD79870.1 acyl carrier protein [Spirosoma fluviale]